MSVTQTERNFPDSIEVGGTKGMGIPYGTEAQKQTVDNSTLRGNSTNGTLEYFINGRWFALQAKGAVGTQKNADFVAMPDGVYPVDTTAGSVTVKLPTNASIGQVVTLIDATASWDVNPLVVSGEGKNIEGNSTNKTLSTKGDVVAYTWTGNQVGWVQSAGVRIEPATPPVTVNTASADLMPGLSYLLDLTPRTAVALQLPENPEIGANVEVTVLHPEDDNADEVEVKFLQAGSGELIELENADFIVKQAFYSMELVYTGDPLVGWKIVDRSLVSPSVNKKTFVNGNFSTIVTDGEYEVVGNLTNYTSAPAANVPTIYGILKVVRRNSVCLQELTISSQTASNVRTSKYYRIGRIVGDNVTFNMAWTRASHEADGARRLHSSPSNLYSLPEGTVYAVNPSVGTPDHEPNDDYVITTIGRQYADVNFAGGSTHKYIEAYNLRTKELWRAHNDTGTFKGWRKNGLYTYSVAEGQTVDITHLSHDIIVLVDSVGDQSVRLIASELVADQTHIRAGDRISIRNLKDDTGVTNLLSDLELIAVDGTNLGKGPHTMTGRGALELVVVSDGTKFQYRCLIGVKQ